MITRRELLQGLVISGFCVYDLTVFGQQSNGLPAGIGIDPDCESPLPPVGTLGSTPALAAEVKVAKAICAKAPPGPRPFDVAAFFLKVGNGDFDPSWKPYTRGWPIRWNPLIVTFFEATATKPEGDLTSWCSAFVNWCFQQSGRGVATHSASSGSFRDFGKNTTNPVPGDIVVFRRTDPVEAAKGRGHVGFFVSQSSNFVEVLGGNQIEGHERSHMVSSKKIPKKGPVLILDSFRTHPGLQA